jgi:predicted membrane channel-forming protein YqfA (hemolysin III family)
MSNLQILGLIGIVLLIIGLFVPLVKVPLAGGISFYDRNTTESIVVIGFATISLILIMAKRRWLLRITSLAIITLVSSVGIQTIRRLLSAKSTAEKIIGEKLTQKLTNVAIEQVHVYWGIAFLLVGAILILICSALIRTQKGTDEKPAQEVDMPE